MAVSPPTPPISAAARAWADELGIEPADAFYFGDSAALADELAALVVAGTKRATTGLVWMHEREGWRIGEPGDLVIITRFDGTPACLIQIEDVTICRFGDVDAEFAAVEGEGDGSLAYWRRVHWDYFGRECAQLGREPSEDMPVVCTRFRLVRVP